MTTSENVPSSLGTTDLGSQLPNYSPSPPPMLELASEGRTMISTTSGEPTL